MKKKKELITQEQGVTPSFIATFITGIEKKPRVVFYQPFKQTNWEVYKSIHCSSQVFYICTFKSDAKSPQKAVSFNVFVSLINKLPIYQHWTPHFPRQKSIADEEKEIRYQEARRQRRKQRKEARRQAKLILKGVSENWNDPSYYHVDVEGVLFADQVLNRERLSISGTNTFVVSESIFNRWNLRKWIQSSSLNGVAFQYLKMNTKVTPKDVLADFTDETKRMYNTPNAGGTSIWSECLSLEVLHTSQQASLVKTEMEIIYDCESKITDFECSLLGHTIGVSVTRVIDFGALMGHRHKSVFSCAEVRRLLEKKLKGIIVSSDCVSENNKWEKQILHVFVNTKETARALLQQYYMLSNEFKHNTFIIITLTSGCDWIY